MKGVFSEGYRSLNPRLLICVLQLSLRQLVNPYPAIEAGGGKPQAPSCFCEQIGEVTAGSSTVRQGFSCSLHSGLLTASIRQPIAYFILLSDSYRTILHLE